MATPHSHPAFNPQRPAEPQKQSPFANANWPARIGMCLTLISFPITNLFPSVGALMVSLLCLFVGFGFALYALVAKDAKKTERWCAWFAIAIVVFNIIAGFVVFALV